MEILKIGMPSGSLADPNRGGNLVKLLENAGFKASGYEAGGPTKFTTVPFLYGWDGRPQEFGSQLALDELDAAIAGDDWIRERVIEFKLEYGRELSLEKVLSLKRGGVKLVGIIKDDAAANTTREFLSTLDKDKKIITVVSEMPYMALNWLRMELSALGLLDRFEKYSVQKYRTPAKIESGIVVYETWGKTEAKVKNGGADIGLEITQTGSAIRNYGLKMIDTVFESETGIYINPLLKNNAEKKELLRMFLLNLYGTVNAENKVMLLFNVPNARLNDVIKYLTDNKLFGDEPTVNKGKEFTELSIQVDMSNTGLPLAKIRYDLLKLTAKNIETIPLSSSIPSLDIVNL
ncbi:MAG: hypothetical protein AABZ39_18785 [Spirochaetota bacterium]